MEQYKINEEYFMEIETEIVRNGETDYTETHAVITTGDYASNGGKVIDSLYTIELTGG